MENLINKNNDRKVKESCTMVQNEHLNCTFFASKSANWIFFWCCGADVAH